jgi:hypothetical protein
MTQASEEQIAARRERIRSEGKNTRVIRGWLVGCIGPMLIWPMMFLVVVLILSPTGFQYFVSYLVATVASCFLLGVAVGSSLTAYHRRQRQRALGEQLTALTPSQRAEVLLPLRKDRVEDTRKIVEPLLRELQRTTEPIPSDAPTGRGDEPTATEECGSIGRCREYLRE